jgi:hypothetical protein
LVTASSNFGFLLSLIGSGGIPAIHIGAGDPEGSEVGNIGDVYLRTDGTFGNSIYSKQATVGSTGWVPVGPRLTDDLTSQATGFTSIFTLNGGAIAFHNTVAGIEMFVHVNGIRQREGGANDFTASESGGGGTGFDTITFTFTPDSGDVILVDYLPR